MSILTKKQLKTFRHDGEGFVLIATVRHDDQCGNGHNTFSITGELYDRGRIPGEASIKHASGRTYYLGSCGCVHDDIAKYFPKLASLLKWHGCTTDGPLHYIANTTYHALEHGPKYAWVYYAGESRLADPLGLGTPPADKEVLLGYLKADTAAKAVGVPGYRIDWDTTSAKTANLEHARSTAIWPDATLEQLRDVAALKTRFPALMAEFRAAVESLGFIY